MKNIVKIDTRFQKSVNLALDMGDMERVNQYIPTRSSVAILKQYLETIRSRQGGHATVLIGPYGKGKSHLLLVLMALLCKRDRKETAKIRKRILQTDQSLEPLLGEKAEQQKPFLGVIISSFQGDLNQSFLYALQEALEREGLEDLSPESEFTEAVRVIGQWEKEYPETYTRLKQELKKRGESPEEFCQSLKCQKKEHLSFFKEIYPLLTSGSVFAPLIQKDALRVYEEVNRILCERYGYSGIYIIFDEFSKYLEGHEKEGFSKDMKILQDMCELADSKKEEQLYLTFVAHKSIHEYAKNIPQEVVQAFRGVEGRLEKIQFVVSSQNNYELIGNVLKKESKLFSESLWGELQQSYELPCFSSLFGEEDFGEIVAKGCYPLTPVCAYALLQISERIGQNERTVFTFLAGNEPGSLGRIIEKRQPKEWVGVDCVYDYFKNLFRETVDQPHIHKEWLKADYALSKTEEEEEQKVIKAMAVIRMIRRPEELAVTPKPIAYALGMDKERCKKAMDGLIEKEIVFFRASLGTYTFKNNIGLDIEAAITKEMQQLKRTFHVCSMLNEVSELTYAIPKQYNQNRAMTRYFRYQFLTVEDFLKIQDSRVFFETNFCDGYILALVWENEAEQEKIEQHLKEWEDKRIIVLLPEERFVMEEHLLRLAAVRSLAQNERFIEENKVLRQELDLYEEDIRYEINEKLKKDFMPESANCHVLHSGTEDVHIRTGMEFNRYLSQICEDYYSLAPKVNHELLNIQNVQGQYLRARNEVVKAILEGEDLEKYQYSSSAEAMVYRAAFVRTGLAGEDFPLDGGCRKILEEIEDFFAMSVGKKVDFSVLYQRLQGKDYGVRKGILPLFLAWSFELMEGMPVVYLGKKELNITVDILNNINQFPESYELYIEKKDMEKEVYLREMEKLFSIKNKKEMRSANRIFGITEGMRQWYRSLSRFTRNSGNYPQEIQESVKRLQKLLKRMDLNPREFLFEQLPKAVECDAGQELSRKMKQVKSSMEEHLDKEKENLAGEVRKIFGGNQKDSLKACLLDWYQKQGGQSKSRVLNKREKEFMEYLGGLNTEDERIIVENLSKNIEDLYMEDWNDELRKQFVNDLEKVRREVEKSVGEAQKEEGKQEIFLKTAEGVEIHKFYEADTKDSTSEFLKNMIEEALDNFGDSLETNQKVAVLAETLEKLLQ